MKKTDKLLGFLVIIFLAVLVVGGTSLVGAWGLGPCTADEVDIGDTGSEAGHDLLGWGPIEPAEHDGNWGGIATDPDSPDKALRVVYSGDEPSEPDSPQVDGRAATLELNPQSDSCYLWRMGLKMRVLDGIGDDDFVVFVKNRAGHWVEVFSYDSDPSTVEAWKEHDITLAGYAIPRKRPIEIKIMATGSNWGSHGTYGQLGVDWVKLLRGGF